MTIGRPQMFKEIKGYNAGGIAGLPQNVSGDEFMEMIGGAPGGAQVSPGFGLLTSRLQPAQTGPESGPPKNQPAQTGPSGLATDTGEIDATTKMLMELLQPKDYEKERRKYEERFSSLMPARKQLNFYDLASELGSAILSRPSDEGPFTGIGIGFGNFQRRVSQADAEERKQKQAFAMKAAELAMTDEKESEKFIQRYAIDTLKARNVTGEPKLITLTYDEVGDEGQFTGRKVQGSFDKVTQGTTIRRIITAQNGVVTSDLPNAPGESKLSENVGKDWVKTQSEIRSNARTATATIDMINEGKKLAIELGPENFGRDEASLLPLKQYLAGFLPKGIIDTGIIGRQESLAQVTIGFTLANVAQTKGAISNREMDLFKEASPFLGQTYEGFMLALDIQEKIARKSMLFATEYQERVNELYKSNQQITGQEMSNEMNNFVDLWRNEGRNLFLTDEDKTRISAFNEQGKALGVASDYSSYESRYRNSLRLRETEEIKLTDRVIKDASDPREALVNKLLNDPDLTQEQREELISKIVASKE